MPTTEQGAMNEKQAAGFLGVSIPTVRKWRFEGRGPVYVKMGRRVVYLTDDLRTYRDGCRVLPRRSDRMGA